MLNEKYRVSALGKTWVFDIDGTIVKHNGYIIDGEDTFLPGAKEFLRTIPVTDKVVFLTSRTEEYKEQTEKFFEESGVEYHAIVYGVPYGERILVNDRKPSGLDMAIAVNTTRDVFMDVKFEVDSSL